MKHTMVRLAIGVPEGLIALSAIWGGIVLLLGTLFKPVEGGC